jgi:hypothetical protein
VVRTDEFPIHGMSALMTCATDGALEGVVVNMFICWWRIASGWERLGRSEVRYSDAS